MIQHNVFLKQQLNHVLDKAFQESFPALKARTFIPVNRRAESVSTKIWDQFGRAEVMNTMADNFPSVSLGQREAFSVIKSLGCYFEYSLLDIRRSQMAGTELDSKLAVAARQTIESKIDELAAVGD